jgi:hypothetical protein
MLPPQWINFLNKAHLDDPPAWNVSANGVWALARSAAFIDAALTV